MILSFLFFFSRALALFFSSASSFALLLLVAIMRSFVLMLFDICLCLRGPIFWPLFFPSSLFLLSLPLYFSRVSRGRGRLRLGVSLSLCSLVLFVLLCLSVMYLNWILLSCLVVLPSVSLSCSWGVPRCCLGSLQSWGFLHRLPWSTLLTPSFSAQALREWRRADGFCTYRPLVRVRVCATHSVRCLVLKLCVCIWTCQFVLSCRGSLRCLFLWA